MSSGFGVRGGVGRCYPIFSALNQCIAQADNREDCSDFRDDYFECLHHFKEFQRAKVINEQQAKNAEILKHNNNGDGGGH
ncbi:NADH-ubiquinone oxidoreductase-like protein [Tribonema minus]|uniref:NADH dehydrogenase [ubiquinone] iron-sulfur protein 5 n=1 Tax=Tribonema minus TaxID=303371 RepID=A0A836CCY2_9STRA|nr:NADH-ubiquinone oxidoreductase-like protein [Tribonema minus]KAG5178848.1 NADH-ubiquinone oxidoreductase-like protein [Tribonema minus]KAG5179470.1 NADH-ubiquinone oxidoreductase-like protein [Tribonema minus]KAG5181062.1 NADH-ubiquinone oxidoreductase-like protein [Tribonema minus]